MKYRIGEILVSEEPTVIETALSGRKITIPKGNKVIIGPDKFAHHIRNGYIQPLQSEAIVEGYEPNGLAEWIFTYLNINLDLDEMLMEFDKTEESFKEKIAEALQEIGF